MKKIIITKSVSQKLRDTFLKCCKKDKSGVQGAFSADMFFSDWFRKSGCPYFFLFQKNLNTTNIQFAELISLTRLHTTEHFKQKRISHIHFFTVKDFISGMQQVVNDLARSKPSLNELCTVFMALYEEVLQYTVLLEVFHGSCSLFFPFHMELDLFKVCGESGYIHSCGRGVYARALNEADDSDFKRAIINYVDEDTKNGGKRFFVVFSHEDFTKYDREFASSLRHGLDDVKIHVEKYSIGKKPLVKVLRELQKMRAKNLLIAGAGDYRKHPSINHKKDHIKGKTMWLMVDRVVNSQGKAGEEQFLICYDQFYTNKNPFHIFDENKPAWVAHTTIPHTLAGAMLNITRPLWPQPDQRVRVYDPFCGTGTTALEAIKLPNVHMTYNDMSPIGKKMIEDNLKFFSLSSKEIKIHEHTFKNLSKSNCSEYIRDDVKRGKPSGGLAETMQLIGKIRKNDNKKDDQWFDIPKEIAQEVAGLSEGVPLRFYLALRTEIRHWAAFERGKEWIEAYCSEAKTLAKQTESLRKLRRKQEEGKSMPNSFVLADATYSKCCTLDPRICKEDTYRKNLLILSQDAIYPPSNLQDGHFDVVVTDPPYGFNNDLNSLVLAKLLTQALNAIFAGLNDQSQLVIALPEHSHSGKKIPLFATKMWVTEQILGKAEKVGFEVVTAAGISPRMGNLFHPPYYWNSEKALKRMILHFILRKKKRLNDESL